jgi:polar amino acid transport system substrate-binding protein
MPARALSRARRHALILTIIVVVTLGIVACTHGFNGRQTIGPTDVRVILVHPDRLTVCTHLPYPPLEFTRHGDPVGFDVDLVGLIAKRLGRTPSFVNIPFWRLTSGQALDTGQCDLAVAGVTITQDRRQHVDFSVPYFLADQALVVRADARYGSLAALVGKPVGVQQDTTGQAYVTHQAPASVLHSFDDFDAEMAALTNGVIDAAVNDSPVCMNLIRMDKRFRIAEPLYTGEQYGFLVRKGGNPRLLAIVDEVLTKAKRDGTWSRLYEKWLHAKPRTIP